MLNNLEGFFPVVIIFGIDVTCALFAQAAGKYKQKGRDYVVEDGDIILFKFNAGAGLSGGKKK